MEDRILVSGENSRSFDKMQIALAIRNSTYEDELSCSLLKNNVMADCHCCNLEGICEKIDEVAKEYLESTTTVLSTFSFK